MKLRHFQWKLLYPYLVLIIISLIFFGYYLTGIFKEFYISTVDESLNSRSNLIKEDLSLLKTDSLNLNEIVKEFDKSSDTRVTIIDISGRVIADSRENYLVMENHSDRPEIIDAIKNGRGRSIRYSHTLQTDMMYNAVPITDPSNKIKFILRTALPLNRIDAAFSSIYTAILITGIIIVLFAFIISLGISKNFSKSLTEMQEASESFARGDFDRKIFPPKDKELRNMAISLNTMASQLSERLAIIGEQRNMQKAVFESMKEGVLAVDYDEKILLINNTAAKILDIPGTEVIGRTMQEVVRISEIQKFFKKIISEGNPQETEIIIQHDKDKVLQLSGTILKDINDRDIGVLVVLNDISNLKHLDTLKKDLVANVSHELKTPVTTIKGFIETLQDSAIDDPVNSQRFLEIVSKHIDRLDLIIDDLLSLSKLEQNGNIPVEMKVLSVRPLLKSVVEDFEIKLKEKKISITIKCDKELTAKLNAHLIEQALSNLLDNAIKYSEKNTAIEIGAYVKDGRLNIYVEDEGLGIAEEHLPRLFERFYRIDKARSREEGGTGLGLAIVKHLVNVFGGTVDVKSEPGKGSIFTLNLPAS